MARPCELAAVEARRLVGERELSAVELLESCVDQIEAVDPAVNAMVIRAFDRAVRSGGAIRMGTVCWTRWTRFRARHS